MTRVSELRLSFIWTKFFSITQPRLLQEFDVGLKRYEQETNKIESGESEWILPWNCRSGRRFWEFYCGNGLLDGMKFDKLSKLLIPFYKPNQVKASPMLSQPLSPISRISVENFYYPHGVAILITIVIKQDLDLYEMVDAIVHELFSRMFQVDWQDGTTPVQLKLWDFATNALGRLHEKVSVKNMVGLPLGEPFTVVTAIDGQEDDLQIKISQDGQMHRVLDALCDLNQLWQYRQPSMLSDLTSFKFKDKDKSPLSHILYGLKRGRAVWFPGYFTRPGGPKIHKLGSYHRNLTLLSLQTESLLGFMPVTTSWINSNPKTRAMLPMIQNVVKGTASTLGRLYGASNSTYNSWSSFRQISDSGLVNRIENVRNSIGIKPATLFIKNKTMPNVPPVMQVS